MVTGIVGKTCVSLFTATSSEISKHVDVSPLLLHSWDGSSNVLQVPLGLYLELTGQIQQGRDPGRLRTCWSEHISHLEDPAVSQDQVAGKRMSGLMCLVCLLAKLDTYTATLSLCVSEIYDQAGVKNDIVSTVWTYCKCLLFINNNSEWVFKQLCVL